MAVCGMCHGSGFFGMERCPCLQAKGRKAFFAKQAKKKVREYELPRAACKHGKIDEILTDTKYLCLCGAVVKIA